MRYLIFVGLIVIAGCIDLRLMGYQPLDNGDSVEVADTIPSMSAQSFPAGEVVQTINSGVVTYRPVQDIVDSSIAGVIVNESNDTLSINGYQYRSASYSVDVLDSISGNFEVGTILTTRGFYSPGDAGAAVYRVQSDSVLGYPTDTVAVIPLQSGNYAVLYSINSEYLVEWFGAISGDGIDDINAINAAIRFAERINGVRGSIVKLNNGVYDISSPIVLPRSGLLPDSTVWLSGVNKNTTRIEGMNTFPVGRGMIEWEAITQRAWNQSISDLTLVLPDVDSVKAIYYKYNQVYDNQTKAITERLNITLRDIIIETNVEFHPEAIKFEGVCSFSEFSNIQVDPSGSGGYEYTTAFVSDTLLYGTLSNENTGINYSKFSNIVVTIRFGGDGQLVKGRLLRCKWSGGFNDGNNLSPDLELYNSYGNIFDGITLEGRNTTQYYLNNSDANVFDHCAIAGPDDAPPSYTNHPGIDIVNSRSNVFRDIYIPYGISFSAKGTHLLRIDSASYDNTFDPLYLGATFQAEVNDSSLAGSNNMINWRRVGNTGKDIYYSGEYVKTDTIDNTSLNNFYELSVREPGERHIIKNTAQTKISDVVNYQGNVGRRLRYEVYGTTTYIKFQNSNLISLDGLTSEYNLPDSSIFEVFVQESGVAYIKVYDVPYGGTSPLGYTLSDTYIPKSSGTNALVNSLMTDNASRVKLRGTLTTKGIFELEPSAAPSGTAEGVGLYFRGDAAESSGRFSGIVGKNYGATTQNGMVFKVGRFGTTYDAAEVNDLKQWTFYGQVVATDHKQYGNTATSTNGSGDITVTFGTAFTASPSSITITSRGTTPYIFNVTARGTSSFTVRVFDTSGAAVLSTAMDFDWIAIR